MKLLEGEEVKVSTAKGFNWYSKGDLETKDKASRRINHIWVEKEYPRYVIFKLDVSEKHNIYYESLNKGALLCGDAYVETYKEIQ